MSDPVAERFQRIAARPVVLDVQNLGMSFPGAGGSLIHALHDVSFQVRRREFITVVGASGCGKSTLVRILAGLTSHTAGEVLLDGKPVNGPGPDRGMVFQGYTLFPWLSVLKNVMFGLDMIGRGHDAAKAEALQWIELVGLAHKADAWPHQLSGGQRQRVAIARALAAGPRILLMDEPFSSVDPIVRDELQQEVLRLQSELAKTIVFVSHDIDEAFLLGDQVIVLAQGGEIVQQGTPEQILADPANDFVASFIGADRGKRRLTVSPTTSRGDDRVLVDAGGYPVGVIAAPDGRLTISNGSPKSRSVSNKTDQAGDA